MFHYSHDEKLLSFLLLQKFKSITDEQKGTDGKTSTDKVYKLWAKYFMHIISWNPLVKHELHHIKNTASEFQRS